jgi:hypothetical protein
MRIGVSEAFFIMGICVIVFIPTLVALFLVAVRSRTRKK